MKHSMVNPFEIILEKLEGLEVSINEIKNRLNKPDNGGVNINKPANRKDAAKYLGVSVSTIDALSKSNQLTTVRIGKSVRFEYKDLDAFLEKKKGK